jgi:hypothetical protein
MWFLWDALTLALEQRGHVLSDADSAKLQTQYQAFIHAGDWYAYEVLP